MGTTKTWCCSKFGRFLGHETQIKRETCTTTQHKHTCGKTAMMFWCKKWDQQKTCKHATDQPLGLIGPSNHSMCQSMWMKPTFCGNGFWLELHGRQSMCMWSDKNAICHFCSDRDRRHCNTDDYQWKATQKRGDSIPNVNHVTWKRNHQIEP